MLRIIAIPIAEQMNALCTESRGNAGLRLLDLSFSQLSVSQLLLILPNA